MRKIYAICTTLEAGHPCDREKMIESGIKVGDKIELAHALLVLSIQMYG